jgi:hypothetical protein
MKKILNKAELLIMGILVIAIALQLLGSKIDLLYSISISGLGLVFFLFAQLPNGQSEPSEKEREFNDLLGHVLMPKVLWIGTAITTIGILFYLNHFPGALNMLLIGGGTITFCTLILIVLRLTKGLDLQQLIPVLYRAFPALLVAAYFALPLV